jgi:hypothetical protein
LPSFDAPIEFSIRRSPLLLAWQSGTCLLGVLACTAAIPSVSRLVGAGGVLLMLLLSVAVLFALCLVVAQFLRAGGARGELSLDARGRLRGTSLAHTPVDLTVGEISLLPGIVVLHIAPSGAGLPLLGRFAVRRRGCVHLARDGIPFDAFRRLRGWSRFGLPSDDAARIEHDAGARR